LGDELVDLRLDNRRLTAVDVIDLVNYGVDAEDLMAVRRETGGGHGSHIAQSKDTDSQCVISFKAGRAFSFLPFTGLRVLCSSFAEQEMAD
jgi:hypothetical protein